MFQPFDRPHASTAVGRDNLIDSGTVQWIARVRRDERQPGDMVGLPVDRVRHIVGETRMTMDISRDIAVMAGFDADWTRRRLRSVAIDPRGHANLATSASIGVAEPGGGWAATVRWRGNDAGRGRADPIRAAAIMGGAMPEGTGWSMDLSTRLRASSRSTGRMGVTLTRWAMPDRDAAMLGGSGSRQDSRLVVNVVQRF